MTLASDQKQNEFFKKVKDINRHQEEEAASQQAVALQMPYIDLYTFPVDLNALAMMSEEQAKEAEAVIFYKEGDDLRIGTVNPDNTMLAAEIEKLAQEKFKPKKIIIEGEIRIQTFAPNEVNKVKNIGGQKSLREF